MRYGSKTTLALVAAVAGFISIVPVANCAPPPSGSKRFLLSEKVNSADVSPDENTVAVERTIKTKRTDGTPIFEDVLELWKFHSGTTVARRAFRQTEAQPSQRIDLVQVVDPRFVRYSNDGHSLVAYLDNTIILFRASDLSPAGTISLSIPDSKTRSVTTKTGIHVITERPKVQAMEVSPTAPLAAILWVRGDLWGRLDIYDFSSRQLVAQWVLPQGWSAALDQHHGIAWDSALPRIFLALPTDCSRALHTSNVFSAGVQAKRASFKLCTGFHLGDIAITHDNELVAVVANSVGIVKNHHPSMKVFSLGTGNLIRRVKVDNGARYRVSVAPRANRIVAWTSDMRCALHWVDWSPECRNQVVKAMFTVWRLPDFKVVTEQEVSPPNGLGLRISAHGHFVLTYGNNVQVFQID